MYKTVIERKPNAPFKWVSRCRGEGYREDIKVHPAIWSRERVNEPIGRHCFVIVLSELHIQSDVRRENYKSVIRSQNFGLTGEDAEVFNPIKDVHEPLGRVFHDWEEGGNRTFERRADVYIRWFTFIFVFVRFRKMRAIDQRWRWLVVEPFNL